MKVCSYNIWNHNENYDSRMEMLIELLNNENVDVLALQEVRDKAIIDRISNECDLEYVCWKKYHECEEGLAILSKYKVNNCWTNWDETDDVHNCGSMYVEISYKELSIGFMNIHLDWKNVYNREFEIVKAVRFYDSMKHDYKFMLGDFNSTPESSVYNFLVGNQSLDKCSTNWIDIGKVYSNKKSIELEPTLDCYYNPRWKDISNLGIPERYDWILIEEPYPNEYPLLKEYRVVGKEIRNGITPSDHYGIIVEMKI